MKWFKHMTASHDDERIAALLDKGGIEGYGFYWLLLEHVSGSIDKGSNNASLTYPLTQWARRLHSHPNRVSKYMGMLGVVGLVSVESVEGGIRVSIPNILKYRDEYTSRKQNTPDTDPTDTRGREEKEGKAEADTEAEKENDSAPDGADFILSPLGMRATVTPGTKAEMLAMQTQRGFQVVAVSEFDSWFSREFWPIYPKKVGKAAAIQAAKRKMTSRERMDRALDAIRRQAPTVDDPRFFPNGSTWFNQERWEDEVYVPAPAKSTPKQDPDRYVDAREWNRRQESIERARAAGGGGVQ